MVPPTLKTPFERQLFKLNEDILKKFEKDFDYVPDEKSIKILASSISKALTKLSQPNFITEHLISSMRDIFQRKFAITAKNLDFDSCK